MPFLRSRGYGFDVESIRRHAPSQAGVYGIFGAAEWIFIGQAPDIRQELLEHLDRPCRCWLDTEPIAFTFEVGPLKDPIKRSTALISELGPICTIKREAGK